MRWLLVIVLLLMPTAAQAQDATPPPGEPAGAIPVLINGVDPLPDPVSLELASQETLVYSILIENRRDGVIRVFDPPAQYLFQRPGEDIGRVVRPARSLRLLEPAALSSAPRAGVITDSRLSGIRLNAQAGTDGVIGQLEIWPGLEIGSSAIPPPPEDHVLQADLAPGYGIFGGGFPVIPGNPVRIYRDSVQASFARGNLRLETGDVIIIKVMTPQVWPRQLQVINQAGGEVALTRADGQRLVRGYLLGPVNYAKAIDEQALTGTLTEAGFGQLTLACGAGESGSLLSLIAEEQGAGSDVGPAGVISGLMGESAIAGAPLFWGFLYPCGLVEQPRLLPNVALSAQFGGDGTWYPLASPIQHDFSQLDGLRIQWLEHDPVVIDSTGLPQRDTDPPLKTIEPASSSNEPPGFRS